MGGISVHSRTQRVIVSSQQRIVVDEKSMHVTDTTTGITIIPAGPQGPPGTTGPQGDPGQDSGVIIEAVMIAHVDDPTPHPAYDDMPNLTIHFENGLF